VTDAADAREIVRRGYDAVSYAYRVDGAGGAHAEEEYGPWLDRVPRGRLLDLGCGSGEPVARLLAERGDDVVGVDISRVQIGRARVLVPSGTFIESDLASFDAEPASFDAVVSFYALIHLPREDQRALYPRIAAWLRPGGMFVATVGALDWTGVEDYLGAPMFWDHPSPEVTFAWLADAGLEVIHHEYVPEGDVGHTLVVARSS
jgi:SAM-dependent methyltransferase